MRRDSQRPPGSLADLGSELVIDGRAAYRRQRPHRQAQRLGKETAQTQWRPFVGRGLVADLAQMFRIALDGLSDRHRLASRHLPHALFSPLGMARLPSFRESTMYG